MCVDYTTRAVNVYKVMITQLTIDDALSTRVNTGKEIYSVIIIVT